MPELLDVMVNVLWGRLSRSFALLLGLLVAVAGFASNKIAPDLSGKRPDAVVDVIVQYRSQPGVSQTLRVQQLGGREKGSLSLIQSTAISGSVAESVGRICRKLSACRSCVLRFRWALTMASPIRHNRRTRKNHLSELGALPPNPRNLPLSGQNGCLDCTTIEALERRTGLRRNATRAPTQAPEWRGRLRAAPES